MRAVRRREAESRAKTRQEGPPDDAALGSAAGAVAQAYGRRIESYLPVQPLAAAAEWVQLPSPAQILPGGWAREDSRKEK